MKKVIMVVSVCIAGAAFPAGGARAQIIEVADAVLKKVIMAIDLRIQRLQTQTIGLQTAQKEVENVLHQTMLADIGDWVTRQRDLYAEYYGELWQVKTVLSDFGKVAAIIDQEARLVQEYKNAYSLFRQDPHFSAEELAGMYRIYDGILKQGIQHLDELQRVITALVTQMDDGDRLHLIDGVRGRMDKDYTDLRQYTQENILISLQRSKDGQELGMVKSLYGIP